MLASISERREFDPLSGEREHAEESENNKQAHVVPGKKRPRDPRPKPSD